MRGALPNTYDTMASAPRQTPASSTAAATSVRSFLSCLHEATGGALLRGLA